VSCAGDGLPSFVGNQMITTIVTVFVAALLIEALILVAERRF
jgi:hypothetical protein